MRRLGLGAALLLAGCWGSHGLAPVGPDAGTSRFEGRWLVDRPMHALYEATIYELAPDGRFVEECSFSLGGGPIPTGVVTREADGLTCELTGPWVSRHDGELAVDCFGDDSVARTVVFGVEWGEDAPTEVRLDKVDGERTGWAMLPYPPRWLPCSGYPEECAMACR